MSEARNHHYVPQSYLRGFADGIGRKAKVRVIDLDEMKVFPTNVRNIASNRDFNRLDDVEGLEPNALEDRYAILEGKAAAAIQNIAATRKFEGEDSMYVLNLMGLLVVRNPRMRETWADFMSRLWKLHGEIIVSKPEIWESTKQGMIKAGYTPSEDVSYEDMRAFIKGDEYDIVTKRLTHIQMELQTWEKVIHLLSARKWRLDILPEGAPNLITCDHPVSIIPLFEMPKSAMQHPVGFGMAETAVIFPLTRRMSLWGAFEDRDITLDLDWLQAALNNSHTMRNADRQIYAYDDDFDYMWGRERRRGRTLLTSLKAAQAERDFRGCVDD